MALEAVTLSDPGEIYRLNTIFVAAKLQSDRLYFGNVPVSILLKWHQHGRRTAMKRIISATSMLLAVSLPALPQENPSTAVSGMSPEAIDQLSSILMDRMIPAGSVIYMRRENCPKPFQPYKAASGRYLVGVQDSKNVGAQIGTSLADGEQRNRVGIHTHNMQPSGAHTHDMTASHLDRYDPNVRPIQEGRGYSYIVSTSTGSSGSNHTHPIDPNSGSNETNAPYIHLLACVRE